MSSEMALTSFASALMMSASASTSALTTPRPPRTHAPGRISSSASTPTCQSRPVPHDLTTPRAQARAARLRAIEAEERREDQAALVMTPAQWALLRHSFVGVKTEFTDLDGLSWDALPSQPPVLARSGTVCGSASASDDRTVRPNQRKRLSVSAPEWQQAVPAAIVARS
ncbi:hypothetical protein EI94DRAFT_1784540 [Lactarius quietus]|nr:hypothetical protein EI94DRAFT_1784540 [Lactarius quietus]